MNAIAFRLPEYEAKAVYFSDSDCIEFTKTDSLCVHERVDSFLTLIRDREDQAVGFQLKGFGYFVNSELKIILGLNETQALQIVEAIVSYLTKNGDEILEDVKRAEAYKVARELAANNYVHLQMSDLSLAS